MESFGASFRRYREEHGISKNSIQEETGVDHANLYRVEERGKAASMRTAFLMTVGARMPTETAEQFLGVALRDRIIDDVRRYVIYRAALYADGRLLRWIRELADAEGLPIPADASSADIRALLREWAEDEGEAGDIRARLAPLIYRSVTLELATGEVSARGGAGTPVRPRERAGT